MQMADSCSSNIPVSIRLNPLKYREDVSIEHLEPEAGVPWSGHGLYLKQRPSFTLDPLFHAGLYYVQDASAMMVGWMFRKVLERFEGPVNVLDLCAAPGGKTTDISASLFERGGEYMLVSNEVIHQRALSLVDNVAKWGDPNIVVSSSDPKAFCKTKGLFDIIVADVPCSGEGMFRKSENARNMWSEDNVQLCASRQRRIIADMWDALAPGGVLVYSTCTLNDAENDDNVKWIADEFGAAVLEFDMPFEGPERSRYGFLMTPGVVRGEGQYCAALVKEGERTERASVDREMNVGLEFFNRNDEVYALTPYVSRQMGLVGKMINVINAGVHAFTLKGRDRVPYADLALSTVLPPDDFPDVALEKADALRFLHRDALRLGADAPNGYVTVSYMGYPLGFVKNLGNRANNLHPQGRRILMNVE